MTYYFVSLKSAKFNDFPERFPIFEDRTWIESGTDLDEALASGADAPCFVVDFSTTGKEVDKWIRRIRDSLPEARIVYVTADMKPAELKAHQLSPVGGDAYVSRQVSWETLERILRGFQNDLQSAPGNKLEDAGFNVVAETFELSSLRKLREDSLSQELDSLFEENASKTAKPKFQSAASLLPEEDNEDLGASMSDHDNDKDFDLEPMDELSLSETPDLPAESPADDGGFDFSLDSGEELSLSNDEEAGDDDPKSDVKFDSLGDLDLGIPDDLSLTPLPEADVTPAELTSDEPGLVLGDDFDGDDLDLSLDGEISPGAKEKLAEIDAIMEEDSNITELPSDLELMEEAADLLSGTGKPAAEEVVAEGDSLDFGGVDDSLADSGFEIADLPAAGTAERLDSDLDQPLVSDDLDLDSLDFSAEPDDTGSSEVKALPAKAPEAVEEVREAREKTSTKIRRKKEKEEERETERPLGQELREISGAYSAELERMQATLSNLRSDREELLGKIQILEEEKLLHNRQTLSLRAELDEKKIELSIVRKKLNEDLTELKDRLRLEDERRLILEEKNRILREEVEKSAQKSRFDVKKVQLRERELEQKLELLKADAETQIRNRDLKILELKRKIDAMEFDMESIQTQEKRTVESRFELEDKLEKAIKTLRSAISVLEDETDKGAALEALKKNIDM